MKQFLYDLLGWFARVLVLLIFGMALVLVDLPVQQQMQIANKQVGFLLGMSIGISLFWTITENAEDWLKQLEMKRRAR